MDNAQIEHELEDLEGRLERLRSLYEQYFMGLEKLEPTVLRKEVDRRMWVLRKEQIRNTGLRFKFQMLVQRYNTYQQYWTRVVREIESGTYRRDILKVAARFGEKDALTILGKKRAEQYKRLAKNQQDRRTRRDELFGNDKGAAAAEGAAPIEEEIALDNDDFELVDDLDDEQVTPPRGVPPVGATGAKPADGNDHGGAMDMETMLQLATVGVKDWAARPRPVPDAPETKGTTAPSEPAPAAPSLGRPPVSSAPSEPASAVPSFGRPTASSVSAAPTTGFGEIAIATGPDPAATITVPAPRASSPGVTSAASKSRVAELAAQMRAKKEAAKPKVDALDLDNLLDPSPAEARPPTAPANPTFRPAPSAQATPIPKVAPAPTSASTTPLPKVAPAPSVQQRPATSPFPRPASTTSLPGGSTPAPKAPPPATAPTSAASAAPKPAPVTPPATGRKEDLSDQKMREIYAKYVGAKRAANESTAGITYDKLASSLRAQAEKIRTTHPTRSVDFEVVTKDGKTALRPIVK